MAAEITTADQLLKAQDLGRCELVRGKLRLLDWTEFEHGRIAAKIAAPVAEHVRLHGLGTVVMGGPGFLLARDPDTVRAADIAFVRTDGPKHGYYPGAPDLAVEVLEDPEYLRDKVAEWLESGTQEVWVVDPRKRTVAINGTTTLGEADTLTSALLPGFELTVREIFA